MSNSNHQLSHINNLGKADLHMHTTYSDGLGSVKEVLTYVEEYTDLDVIAITDHDCIGGAILAREIVAQGSYGFEVIVGEEISTQSGHLLALFIESPVQKGLTLAESIRRVKQQGGLAIIAHPFNRLFRHSIQHKDLVEICRNPELRPDGIEVLNSSFAGIGSSQLTAIANRRKYKWAEVGNSDAHTVTAVGCGYTLFEGKDSQTLRDSILNYKTSASGGFWSFGEYVHLIQGRVRNRQKISQFEPSYGKQPI